MIKSFTIPVGVCVVVCLVGLMVGCNPSTVRTAGQEKPAGEETLEGVLLRHPDAHTKQSMLTGNYHVKTDDGQLHAISPSESVSEETFDTYHESRVRVFGQLIQGELWDETDEMQGPSLQPGGTWRWPDSFEVRKLEELQ